MKGERWSIGCFKGEPNRGEESEEGVYMVVESYPKMRWVMEERWLQSSFNSRSRVVMGWEVLEC